jgi:hypothetical protein
VKEEFHRKIAVVQFSWHFLWNLFGWCDRPSFLGWILLQSVRFPKRWRCFQFAHFDPHPQAGQNTQKGDLSQFKCWSEILWRNCE